MGALTDVYVAATSGSDGGGNGSSGNPYKTVQHVLNNVAKDTTNGNYITLSGKDTLSASLSFSTWGASDSTAHTVLRNWTGGPDGQGELDGNNGNVKIFNSGGQFIHFIGLKLGNTGSAVVVENSGANYFIDCEIHTSTGGGLLLWNGSTNGGAFNCYVHNCGGTGVYVW